MAKFGALFDLDGVLIDTETVYTRFWERIDSMYPTNVPDFAKVIKGTTLPKILSTYFPEKSVQDKVIVELVNLENRMVYEAFGETYGFLGKLRSAGVPMAIVTSSNSHKMSNLFGQLPKLREYIGNVICDEDVSRSKPDPEGYMKAAAKIGMEPEKCIVFEDSFVGLQAGKSSGAKVVALATTNPFESLQGRADLVVNNLGELRLEDLEALIAS